MIRRCVELRSLCVDGSFGVAQGSRGVVTRLQGAVKYRGGVVKRFAGAESGLDGTEKRGGGRVKSTCGIKPGCRHAFTIMPQTLHKTDGVLSRTAGTASTEFRQMTIFYELPPINVAPKRRTNRV